MNYKSEKYIKLILLSCFSEAISAQFWQPLFAILPSFVHFMHLIFRATAAIWEQLTFCFYLELIKGVFLREKNGDLFR